MQTEQETETRTPGILRMFLDRAHEGMEEGSRNIMEPAYRRAPEHSPAVAQLRAHARSLAGTAITRWASMTLRNCGLDVESLALEKAQDTRSACLTASQLQATAQERVAALRIREGKTAAETLESAHAAGTWLQRMEDPGTDPQAAAEGLSRACVQLLELCWDTLRDQRPPTGFNPGEEARHAVEAASDGSSPEGIPGSRGWLRKPARTR